ncbi:hypothetical protein [Streptomyces sp. CBMA156]|uniref:hypothetical protein n=1 Tax=Streptomyces sp. CBMA156 TaxID=1930280 RepID=UPI001661EF7D|nr:hypothetical protein [Streptomyces sp. CBMA156]MBD0673686.1 hypothetical protein [Streptomyces sp. CBMA156]
MTSLHPAATDPSLPGPPRDAAGSSPPHAVPGPPDAVAPAIPAVPMVPAVPMCSIATAAEPGATTPGTPDGAARQGCASRHDSVPQPRSRNDVEAAGPFLSGPETDGPETDGPEADGDPTTTRLRAAFADRLRAAHAQGRSVAELAQACRRPLAEVRVLLGLDAAAEDGPAAPDGPSSDAVVVDVDGRDGSGAEAGFVRFRPADAPPEDGPSVPTPRAGREDLRILGSRRPSPSRRLRRMHPQAARTGQGATARETAATDPTGAGLPDAAGWTDGSAGTAGTAEPTTGAVVAAAQVPPSATGTGSFGVTTPATGSSPATTGPVIVDSATTDSAAVGPAAVESTAGTPWAEPQLGILIGGSPGQADTLGRPEERAPVRVAARPIRVGRGTCLVVLPSWRPAIAVSVSTEQLLSATGLGFGQLADAQLTVLMNPGALHDRELELHGWESGPAGRPRRGGRP